jgi:hypothetical protein
VVTPEITRVTGVTIDEDESFDNGGSDYSQKLALIMASDQWPNLIWNPTDADELARKGLIYNLTNCLPKYAKDLLVKIPIDKTAYPQIADHVYPKSAPGRMHGIPFGLVKDQRPPIRAAFANLTAILSRQGSSIGSASPVQRHIRMSRCMINNPRRVRNLPS